MFFPPSLQATSLRRNVVPPLIGLYCFNSFSMLPQPRESPASPAIEARHNVPLAIDQELGEIPFDIAGQAGIRLLGQILIEGSESSPFTETLANMGKVTLYLSRAEALNLRIRAGFLAAEIVGRKTQDHKALVLVFFIKRFQSRILRREAAAAGNIHQQNDLALVTRKRSGLAIDGRKGEIVDAFTRKQRCRERQNATRRVRSGRTARRG